MMPDNNSDDLYQDWILISKEEEATRLVQEFLDPDKLQELSKKLGEKIEKNPEFDPENHEHYLQAIAETVQGINIDDPNIREFFEEPIKKMIQSYRENKNIDEIKGYTSLEVAKHIAAGALVLGIGGAGIWFSGPFCALAARSIFSAGYGALFGTPSVSSLSYWVAYLPLKEHVGALAYNYGGPIVGPALGGIACAIIECSPAALTQLCNKVGDVFRSEQLEKTQDDKAIVWSSETIDLKNINKMEPKPRPNQSLDLEDPSTNRAIVLHNGKPKRR